MEGTRMLPQPAPAPRRSLGTSGVFFVPDLSPSINPTDERGAPMLWADILKAGPRDKVATLTAAALESLRSQGLAAQHACRQIHGDQTLGEAERHRRAAKASADLFVSAQAHVEKAQAAHLKSVEELDTMLAGPTVELSDVRGVEIRSKLAGLAADKRFAAISRAIARGDDSTVAAVLGSDRLLTDFLTDIEIGTVRQQWALARHPDEVALLAKRKSDLKFLETASAVARSWQAKTHLPAIAMASPAVAAQRGAPGPAPTNRGASTLESRAMAMKEALAR
jgi:hypothetical protein